MPSFRPAARTHGYTCRWGRRQEAPTYRRYQAMYHASLACVTGSGSGSGSSRTMAAAAIHRAAAQNAAAASNQDIRRPRARDGPWRSRDATLPLSRSLTFPAASRAQPERETAETPPCPALKTPPLHDADDVTGAGLGQVAWPYPAIPLPTSPAPVRRGRDDSSNRTTIRAPYTTAAVRLPHLTGRPAARRALCPPPSVGARPLLSRPVRLPPFVVFLSFPRARASAPVQVPTHTLALRGKSTTAASCAPTREPASQPPYHA